MSKLNRIQKIILAIIAVFVGIGIILRSITGFSTSNLGYDGVTMLKYALIEHPAQTIKGWFRDVSDLWAAKEENDQLHYELSKNPSYKAKYLDEKQKNAELSKQLKIMQQDDTYQRVFANVIARDASMWNNEITIDKGNKDGIIAGMAVESTDGMIGKVKSVSAYTSVIKLLTSEDKRSSLSIKILMDDKNSSLGILQNYDVKKGRYVVTLFDDSDEIKKGMQVVTSGKGEGSPSGLLIGTVESVQALNNSTGQTLYVKPIDNFQTFNTVSVLIRKEGNK